MSSNMKGKRLKCGFCGKEGHNTRKCGTSDTRRDPRLFMRTEIEIPEGTSESEIVEKIHLLWKDRKMHPNIVVREIGISLATMNALIIKNGMTRG